MTTTLGKFIEDPNAGRDAVHVAVAPVKCGEVKLVRGQRIAAFCGVAILPTDVNPAIGIVDPFLERDPEVGEFFWLCMFPKTVTDLRHEWSHPAFVGPEERDAHVWMKGFAASIDKPLDEVMRAAAHYLETSVGVQDDEMSYNEVNWTEFWKKYQFLTKTDKPLPLYNDGPYACCP